MHVLVPADCGALYATGNASNLESSRRACKAHQVTLHGGILAAIAVAFARSQQRLVAANSSSNLVPGKLSLSLDVDYNRRKPGRLPGAALGDDHVGLNISFATLEGYKAGVDLNQVRPHCVYVCVYVCFVTCIFHEWVVMMCGVMVLAVVCIVCMCVMCVMWVGYVRGAQAFWTHAQDAKRWTDETMVR